ncbi:hypothetical protein GWK48_10315 [Metallosphaera tengchongensis]|uniref:PIN domain-containing protein n=1 Tax=Metallosphaera tengchongensis TaxID=1532350 RepID=A0A6N0NWY1_9CREN|nr:PIN domain-containing protein [Metallosphaera tengchongensis]QKR00727.1 hypothetical protein GWK48_10315 [Metallosphaera tengchongensis]
MKLAVLGSDKLVTTTNALLSEVFTGTIPSEVVVLSESQGTKDLTKLGDILSLFSDVEIPVRQEVIGEGVEKWRQKVSTLDVDVADVTPGRKYMAVSVYAYSRANEVRYVYLKNEGQGYRVFGYVPFNEIKVVDVRGGKEIPFSPPKVNKGGRTSFTLSQDGLRALLNVYSLLGEVKVSIGGDELSLQELPEYAMETDDVKTCAIRSGLLIFKEEAEVRRKVDQNTFFIADTNAYVNLGRRLGEITWSREFGRRLLPSRSVYNEIESHTNTTQKNDPSLKLFQLASYSFLSLHAPPYTSQSKGSGDIPLLNEVTSLKGTLPHVVLITGDAGVTRSAQAKGIDVVFLNKVVRGSPEGVGEFLQCLSLFGKDVEVLVEDRTVARLKKQVRAGDEVEVYDQLRYAWAIEMAEKFIRE